MDEKSTKHSRYPEYPVLEELDHLNLSNRVTVNDVGVASAGGYGDILKGSCFLANGNRHVVAIKRLRFYLKEDIKLLFENEIYVWSKLKHNNILPLLGYAFDNESRYPLLISEWMVNGSAWAYVTKNPNYDVMRLVVGTARGLAYLHEYGVIHSDIKSDNILVSLSGDAILCDFGCSRLNIASRAFARTSSVIGTMRYMAPELFHSNASDGVATEHTKETDMWAFGMAMFELLSRQHPYAKYPSDINVSLAVTWREAPFPMELSKGLQSDTAEIIRDICQSCWDYEPQKRPSISYVLSKFEEWARCHAPLLLLKMDQATPGNTHNFLDEESSLLSFIAPSILSELTHIDLHNCIDSKKKEFLLGGGNGDVYRGVYSSVERGELSVCLKCLRFYRKDEIKLLFENEIYVWSKLKHDNILPLLGFIIDEETSYPLIVSEWMENGSAWNYVQKQPYGDLRHLITGAARGLKYLHDNGVVHSDIKSDNILVSKSGDALLCDFGCSSMMAASRNFAGTRSGLGGTMRYLAIELLESSPASDEVPIRHTKQTDVWAFGMTVFELISKQRPYSNFLDPQVPLAIVKHQLPSFPSNLQTKESKLLKDICLACWIHDPMGRPSISNVLARLEPQAGRFPPHLSSYRAYTHQMMSPLFLRAGSLFEGVSQCLNKIDEMLQADASSAKTTQYSETWKDFSQEFESIIASVHEIATLVELCINDYDNAKRRDFKLFEELHTIDAVKGRMRQLAQLEEGLRCIFGVNVYNFIDISERVSKLKQGIASIEFQLNSLNMKNSSEVCDEMIRNQTHPSMDLTERYWNLISAPFSGMQFSGVQKQYGNSKFDGTLARTVESGWRGMNLKPKQIEARATVINECYTQIGAIKDSLDSIEHTWMSLAADAQQLLAQLSVIATRENNVVLFYIALENFESQCKEASKAFHEFIHCESIQQAAQVSDLFLSQPQLSTHQQSWFRRKRFF